MQIDPGAGGAGGAGGSGSSAGGGLPGCTSEAQCPLSPSACARASCLNSVCGFINEPPMTPCAGTKLCDGNGACLECLATDDCVGEMCLDGSCVSMLCSNGLPDPGETGVDCGGPECPACTTNGGCTSGADCQSGYCDLGAGGSGGAGGAGGAGGGQCANCTSDDHCADIADTYCELGACTPKKVTGVACLGGNECQSGFCPQGDSVCCADACGGLCRSCNGMYTGQMSGACHFITANTDPFDECTLLDLPVAMCKGDGSCVLLH